ncbi:MAG: hypothetical protein H0T51_22555, partial [Pirellulales bacterium]|nr:hypothetical protein [Pirellulales bacterium]
QFAYTASFTDGTYGTFLYTPEPRWRQNVGGSWDAAANWTLSIRPGVVHDVTINPSTSLTVLGPAANASVKSLQVGGSSGAVATIEMTPGGSISSALPIVINTTGVVAGSGAFNAPVTNNGALQPGNLTFNGTLTNNSVISTNGAIVATTPLVNAESGVLTGGLTITGDVINQGTIIANDVSISGTLTNDGSVTVGSGAQATFHGNVMQNGTFRVNKVGGITSSAVVLGAFSGTGGSLGGATCSSKATFARGTVAPV